MICAGKGSDGDVMAEFALLPGSNIDGFAFSEVIAGSGADDCTDPGNSEPAELVAGWVWIDVDEGNGT